MVAPMLQGNIPQGGNTVNSLQLAGAGNGEAESLALHLSLSGTSVEGIGVEATGANAGAGADSSLTLLTEAQALFSEEMPLQTGVQEEAGLQNPKVLEGKGDAAAAPTNEGQKTLAFRFQGAPQAGETTGSSGENAVKAFQEAKPVQAVRPEGVSQGVLESTGAQSSSKQIDLTASTPTGSSGNEADLGLGQAGNTGQVGVNAVSAEAVPAQNQEAFIGRLDQVLQEQMLAKSELLMRDGRAEIRLELKPEYLGRLFVRLSLENGALNVNSW